MGWLSSEDYTLFNMEPAVYECFANEKSLKRAHSKLEEEEERLADGYCE